MHAAHPGDGQRPPRGSTGPASLQQPPERGLGPLLCLAADLPHRGIQLVQVLGPQVDQQEVSQSRLTYSWPISNVDLWVELLL